MEKNCISYVGLLGDHASYDQRPLVFPFFFCTNWFSTVMILVFQILLIC